MLKLLHIFLLTALMSAKSAYSNDSFWQFYDKPRYFSLNFNIQQLGDLCRYQEYHSRTEGMIRRQFVSEAMQLMRSGAGGIEALQMVLAFDDRAYQRRELAKLHVGRTLAQVFRTALDKINQNYFEQGGTPLITFVNGRANYSINLKWGTTAKCQLYSTVVVRNDLTSVTRTYTANGPAIHVDSLGHILAMKLFHSLHHTRFPVVYNESSWRKKIFHHPKMVNLQAYKTVQQKVEHARNLCKNQGRMQGKNLRLTTKKELELITSLPQYFGGINLPNRKSGFVVLNSENAFNGQILNLEHINGTSRVSGDISLRYQYICLEVKEN